MYKFTKARGDVLVGQSFLQNLEVHQRQGRDLKKHPEKITLLAA